MPTPTPVLRGNDQNGRDVPPLDLRDPTGIVPWPLILLEGEEKTGKSYACAVLSASGKVGRTMWLDLAEGAADEYKAVPGARYKVIRHDGSWNAILGQVRSARAEARRARDAGEPPVVLIVDTITAEWEMLKDWADARARTTEYNRNKLARDPNAEVTVTQNLWNDARDRHLALMAVLMTFPGIVIMTARGGEVSAVENGKPVEGKKAYRVEGHKTLGSQVNVQVRLTQSGVPVITGARSVHLGVRPGIDEPRKLGKDWTLEHLIFGLLKCDPVTAHVRDLVELKSGVRTPEQIRDEACDKNTTPERLRELWFEAKDADYGYLMLTNDVGTEEPLGRMIERLGKERRVDAAPSSAAGPPPPADAVPPAAAAPETGLVAADDDTGDPAADAAGWTDAPADAKTEPAGVPTAEGESAFVADMTVRLSDAKAAFDDAALGDLLLEVGRAKNAGTIRPATYQHLTSLVKDARQSVSRTRPQAAASAGAK